MATMNVYCQIDGMPGECSEQGHADWCDVLAFNHQMTYNFDFRQGRGTAEPSHSGVTIVKPLDKASPLLAEACSKKKKIAKVVIEFMRDNPADGSTQMYYVITLEDCRVVMVRPTMREAASQAEQFPHCEEVSFGYRKIIWKQDPDSQETQFDFANPTG